MRLSTNVITGILATAILAAPCAAQRAAPIEDNWFWGFKGGINTFATSRGSTSVPSWGLDWLITREHGGLYVAADQSFFDNRVTATDAASPSGSRDVQIKNMNRVSFAMVAFPKSIGVFTPYGGVGAAISVIGQATPRADSLGGAAGQTFIDKTDKARSRASLLVMAGIQTQSRRVGFFIQETVLPAGRDFLVKTGMNVFEIGLRHSFGSPSESSH